MNEGLYTLIAGIAGALITGLFTFFAGKSEKDQSRMKTQIVTLAEQVGAFWLLEKAYAQALAKAQQKSPKTVLEAMRAEVEKSNEIRPYMTKQAADRIRSVYSDK